MKTSTPKNLTAVLIIAGLIFISANFVLPAFASTTDGIIDPANRYAWSENAGWIDFGTEQGNVHVTNTALTGYAYGENLGWISLNCSNDNTCDTGVDYGVVNTAGGILSGLAWSENAGWIDFAPAEGGVSINSSGEFFGYAYGENIGWIVFSCATTGSCGSVNYMLATDWRPQAPMITIVSPQSNGTVSADDTMTFSDSDLTSPQCSLDNTNWIDCASDVTSFSQLIGWSGIADNGNFTLYLTDTNNLGTGTADATNLTKSSTQAPIRSDGSPAGELSNSITQTTLSLKTDKNATCKYSATSQAYADMGNTFVTTGGQTHSQTISGLSAENSYTYYVRCEDDAQNANDTDYLISFSLAAKNTVNNNLDKPAKAKLDSFSYKIITDLTDCPQKLELTLTGHHLKKNSLVKIGNEKAASLRYYSSQKIKARFCLQKLQNIQTDPSRIVSVQNPNTDNTKATKKLNLSLIPDTTKLNPYTIEGIQNIQKILVKEKLLPTSGVTGLNNQATTEAVKAFQVKYNIPATGFVGTLTIAKIGEVR